MATNTTRDEIWITALAKVAVGKAVRPQEVMADVGCSERTVRDCLNAAARTPYLERDVLVDGTVRYLPRDPSASE